MQGQEQKSLIQSEGSRAEESQRYSSNVSTWDPITGKNPLMMDVSDIYWSENPLDNSSYNVYYLHFCGYSSDGWGNGYAHASTLLKAAYKLQKYAWLMEWDRTFEFKRPSPQKLQKLINDFKNQPVPADSGVWITFRYEEAWDQRNKLEKGRPNIVQPGKHGDGDGSGDGSGDGDGGGDGPEKKGDPKSQQFHKNTARKGTGQQPQFQKLA